MTTATCNTINNAHRGAMQLRTFGHFIRRCLQIISILLVGTTVISVDAATALAVHTGGAGAGSGGAFSTSMVSFNVDERGQVADCHVAGSSGRADLDARACGVATTQFRPKPARSKGRAVKSTTTFAVRWAPGGVPIQ